MTIGWRIEEVHLDSNWEGEGDELHSQLPVWRAQEFEGRTWLFGCWWRGLWARKLVTLLMRFRAKRNVGRRTEVDRVLHVTYFYIKADSSWEIVERPWKLGNSLIVAYIQLLQPFYLYYQITSYRTSSPTPTVPLPRWTRHSRRNHRRRLVISPTPVVHLRRTFNNANSSTQS